eukprot:TRINITY_DN7608_c0_g1_i1.p1 TRINITY_DN7608_c0_g1~~TRINITY_DN7608_c0_g1_i1.p1  ORF type:complete len:242 (-),score=57.59 TRINITY_DN7608_c0_g1_i1:29-754(-)
MKYSASIVDVTPPKHQPASEEASTEDPVSPTHARQNTCCTSLDSEENLQGQAGTEDEEPIFNKQPLSRLCVLEVWFGDNSGFTKRTILFKPHDTVYKIVQQECEKHDISSIDDLIVKDIKGNLVPLTTLIPNVPELILVLYDCNQVPQNLNFDDLLSNPWSRSSKPSVTLSSPTYFPKLKMTFVPSLSHTEPKGPKNMKKSKKRTGTDNSFAETDEPVPDTGGTNEEGKIRRLGSVKKEKK